MPGKIRNIEEPLSPSAEDLDQRVASAVRRAIGEQEGDVLVFLPGKGEIDACREACEQAVPRDVNVLPFHAGLHAQSIDRVFANRLNRRVFLAANVAETSLTLSGVRTVIDSGLARQIEHRGSQNALALMAASQASLDQRAGRAGRTAPSVCIRLFSSSFDTPPSDRPEIERLARHLLERIPEQAFVLRLRAKRRSGRKKGGLPYANGQVELSVYPWDDGEERSIPDAGLILRAFWSSGRDRGIVGHGSLFLPCDPSWLKPASGHPMSGRCGSTKEMGCSGLWPTFPERLPRLPYRHPKKNCRVKPLSTLLHAWYQRVASSNRQAKSSRSRSIWPESREHFV
ncbi:TPA: hypothetical protein DCE37_07600 [Candidatus Latescibacteria bacterium]|nr:hypothetical protein [Candidatus Latescibacterota bacterium]